MLSCFSRGQLFCNPMDYSPPGSSVRGVFQARILEWAAMPSSRASSPPRDGTCISYASCTAGGFFTTVPPGKPQKGAYQMTTEPGISR